MSDTKKSRVAGGYCTWCNKMFRGEGWRERFTEHAEACEKHPAAIKLADVQRDVIDQAATIDALRATLDGANARCLELTRERDELNDAKDGAYMERNRLVALLATLFPSGVARTAIEGWSEDWHGCVYIDLPNGQASWHFHDSHAHLFAHLRPYAGSWDGHTTEQKYQRIAALAAAK